MRLRKRFIVVVLIIAALLGGGFFYYEQPSVKARIKDAVVQALSAAVGDEVSIDSLSIGLFSATASNIKFSMDFKSFQVEIEKIKIGFGIMKLPVISKINAQNFIERIIIVNPKIKIILYANADAQDDKLHDIENLSCSQWSRIIVENVPFQTAKIRNCTIEIVTKNDRRLVNFTGLNGDLIRKNEEVDIELSGISGGLLKKNVFISSKISPIVENQFVNVKFESVEISSPLLDLDGDMSFVINGDVNFLFADKYFPEAIIPNGNLDVKRLRVRDKKRGVIFSGAMDVLLKDGINTAEITAAFEKGKLSGSVEMDLNQSGKTTGSFDVSASLDGVNSLVLNNKVYLSDIISPKVFFETNGKIKRSDKIDTVFAMGKFIDNQAVLDSLTIKMQDIGKGVFSGFFAPAINYELDGNIDFDIKVNQDISVDGAAKIIVSGESLEKLPTIAGSVSNAKFMQDGKEINLPKLRIQTFGDTLRLETKDEGILLSGEINLKENFPYTADISVPQDKIKEIFELQSKTFPFKNGSFSAHIDGDTSLLRFDSKINLAANDFGEITADLKGRLSKKQKILTINSADWLFEKNIISFVAEMKEVSEGWNINLVSKDDHIKLSAVLDTSFEEINSGNITINKFPLEFFNTFDKSKKDHDLIKSGDISGHISTSGTLKEISAEGKIKIQNVQIENIKDIETDFSFSAEAGAVKFPHFTVKHNNSHIINSKKLEISDKKVYCDIEVDKLKLENYLPLFEIPDVKGIVNARITSDGGKIFANLNSDSVFYKEIKAQKIKAQLSVSENEISLNKFDGEILGIKAAVDFIASHKKGKVEDAEFNVKLNGDFLAAAGNFKESPIGGKGEGSIYFSGNVLDGSLNITGGRILIPKGSLTVFPFVRGSIENVYADVKFFNEDSLSIAVQGVLDKKRLTIRNDYKVGELTPFRVANLNLGVLRVWTDKGGIPVFLPGFMENRRGNVGWIETAKKGDIPVFTVASHPENFITLAGTLLLRKSEITFPLLDDVEYPFDFDAFPHLFFDLDIRPADRTVSYFYQLGSEKRRRSIRIIECTIDPSGTVGVRGNEPDGTFKIVGSLRSYNGYMYYGKMFDRNFEIGLDFQPEPDASGGYDNLPIIWGRAETYSDTNRLERVSVKLKTRDENTGELRERGRFTELVISPENDNIYMSQDEAAADYYGELGYQISDIEEIGKMASQIGDSYLSSYFLSYWGRQAARKIGLDMFRFETSVMRNSVEFLAAHQIDQSTTRNWNYLAFANTAFTMGKYIFGNDLFLKYQTELVPRDFDLTPEHKIGIEYQPLPYLWMDFNYGFFREAQTEEIIMNPEVRLQLRMPFSDLKNILKRKSREGESKSQEAITPIGSPPPPARK